MHGLLCLQMGNDSSNSQCLLHAHQEPDGFPGGYFAKSVLRATVPAQPELRRHGRSDGARVDACVRRPGARVRQGGQPAPVVEQ